MLIIFYQVAVVWRVISMNHKMLKKQSITTTKIERPADITKLHLFGIFDASTQALPQTQLQLSLQGTVITANSNQLSYAIISSPTTSAKIYKVGDRVPGNAVIRRILKNQVILDDHGTLESLHLPFPQLASATKSNLKLNGATQ